MSTKKHNTSNNSNNSNMNSSNSMNSTANAGNAGNASLRLQDCCASFAALEPEFQQLKEAREKYRNSILENLDASAFDNGCKTLPLPCGVAVKRAVRLSSSLDRAKVNSEWLRRFLNSAGASALAFTIDPRVLVHDDETGRLLSQVGYQEKVTYVHTVLLDALKRETK